MISPDFPFSSSRPSPGRASVTSHRSFSEGGPAPASRPSFSVGGDPATRAGFNDGGRPNYCDSGFESRPERSESLRSVGEGGASTADDLRSPNSDLCDPAAPLSASAFLLPPIQLTRWKTHHEVNPSRRTWEGLDRVWLPTHFDCAGHRFLAAQPDALALLAIWTLLVGLTARLPRPLRGLLVTETGHILDAAALAQITGLPVDLLTRALAVFADPRVGWLVSPVATTIPGALAEIAAYRAAEAAWRRETAAIARLRRQYARKLRVEARRTEAHFAAAYPQPVPSPVDTWPANFADLTPAAFPPLEDLPPLPTKRRRRPAWERPLPAGVPADWREILPAVAPPGTNKTVNHYATVVWQDLAPALQQKVLDHAAPTAPPAPASACVVVPPFPEPPPQPDKR